MQNSKTPAPNTNAVKGKRETITELAHRHLKDQNHTTSDEELRNAVFTLTGELNTDNDNLFEADNTARTSPLSGEKNNNGNDNSNSLPNPYNILS